MVGLRNAVRMFLGRMNVGRIGMVAAYPEKVGAVLAVQRESLEEVLAAERQALGMDHCEAGWWLAKTWSLPESLLEITCIVEYGIGAGAVLPVSASTCPRANARSMNKLVVNALVTVAFCVNDIFTG